MFWCVRVSLFISFFFFLIHNCLNSVFLKLLLNGRVVGGFKSMRDFR